MISGVNDHTSAAAIAEAVDQNQAVFRCCIDIDRRARNTVGNATEIAAAGKDGIPKPVELLIAGHIHTFEAINYVDNKVPPQILAGGGGDMLDKTPVDLAGTIFQGASGVSVKDGLSVNGFSFLLMTKQPNGWNIALYDAAGAVERNCVFASGRVDCPK